MKIKQIYNILNEISPFELAQVWDNSGLLVGNFEDEVQKIYLSLDLDSNLINSLEPNSLIITHHPLIFKPLKQVNFNDFSTKLLRELIKKNISLISMHTNFDKTHLNSYVLMEILGFKISKSDDFINYFEVNMSFEEFHNLLIEKLNLNFKRCVRVDDFIKSCAIITGSGGSLIKKIKANCLISGDIKYHEALEAREIGLNLIDIGHFESEKYFAKALETELKKKQLKVIIADSINPFS